jgi:hypothetical protein
MAHGCRRRLLTKRFEQVIAKTVETSDYAVRVECTTEAGTTADLKWGPTAEPFYQMVRIHNYDSTVQQQTQLAQEVGVSYRTAPDPAPHRLTHYRFGERRRSKSRRTCSALAWCRRFQTW